MSADDQVIQLIITSGGGRKAVSRIRACLLERNFQILAFMLAFFVMPRR